jgi:type IV pilus assembly protein PilV
VNTRGYTIIEVMMSLAVLTLGALGVIAMQKATLIGNTNARNLATATTIAQAWIERLRVDAQAWTEPGGVPGYGPNTKWITTGNIGAGWFVPTQTNALTSPVGGPQADVMGADVMGTDHSSPAFCTNLRIDRFFSNPNLWSLYRMIRVQVRVYWDKSGRPLDCSAALPNDYQLGRYGFVYLVSGALENNSPI